MTDYYEVLGVTETADLSTLRAAYLRRARECHPDRGGSHAEMILLNEAWEILANPNSRRDYDALRKSRPTTTGATAFEETVSQARKKAQAYPRDWSAFEKWADRIAGDFARADYKTERFLGVRWPTAYNSFSGCCFIFAGAIVGMFAMIFLFGRPPLPGDDRRQISPILPMFGLFIGAWAGAFLHQLATFAISELRKASEAGKSPDPQRSQIIECEKCQQKLRVPILESELKVTCAKCGHQFEQRSPNAPPLAAGPRELYVVSRETCAATAMVNAALSVPLLNCLMDGVFFSNNAWVWIGGNVIAGVLSCMSAAWCLGKNLVILEIRQAEDEVSKDELRPLRKTVGADASGRVVIYGAIVGLGSSILSFSLGPFLKFIVVLVSGYIAGLFVYDKVAVLVRRLCMGTRSSQSSAR